jgi:Tol biopolymer transport system component
VLLEAARKKEILEGDLEAAIRQYKEIIATHSGDRQVAAKALVRMGQCYEKLGQTGAQEAYREVIENYPEQRVEVAAARQRLAVLAKALREDARKPNFRKIRVPSRLTWGAGLSPDGKKLAMVSEGSIWLLPIQGKVNPDVAGVPQKLTVSLPDGVGVDRDPLTWSADGKWITFGDHTSREKGPWVTRMYVVSSEGGVPRKLPVAPDRGVRSVNYRLGLSPDGEHVAFASMENEELHIETIAVDGGPAKRLTEPPSSEPAYSPNGRLIAYVARRAGKTAGERDRLERSPGGVWVIPVEGGTPVLVAHVNKQAQSPIWSPDGRMIAFGAGRAVWVVPVSQDGKPTAAPTKFDPPNPFFSVLAGWTTDNKIGLLLKSRNYAAIYTVPASGGQAAQVTPAGFWSSPKWAPDGKKIFFRNHSGHVSFVPADGGEVSEVPFRSDVRILEPGVGGENAVSPDGRTIVFAAMKDGAPGVHLWTIPVEGGEPKQLTSGQSEAIENRFPCWSSDGKWIAFVRGERLKDDVQYYANVNIYRIPAEGGAVRQLTTASDKVHFRDIAWSPDRKHVAYFSAEDKKTIKVKSLESGESRVVGKAERPGWNSLSWSPDGKRLAFTPASNVQGPFSRIRIVLLDDGTTAELETGLGEQDYWHVSWSPDGTRLAFGAMRRGEPELWFMEDFVHLVKTDN